MKKELFVVHFQDYVPQELECKFEDLKAKEVAKCMARFYADKVLRVDFPSLIPEAEEDINECIIDGSDDCDVDFLVRQGNTVLVIQAKYSGVKKRGKRTIEEAETFESFSNVLARLYAGPEKYKMNRKLREARVDIDWERDNFILHYITLHQPAQNSWATAERGVAALADIPDLPERTTLELLDADKLNLALRDAMQREQGHVVPIHIMFSENPGQPSWLCFEDSGNRSTYVGRVNGAQMAMLYKAHKSRLFTMNIRNYIGDTTTNREIRKTARETPGDFFYRNNGICAVATRIAPDEEDEKERTLVCENLSIINGAQTIRSLAKAHSEDAKSVHDVEVLLRIFEYKPKMTQSEQRFLDNVIRYNNTQNAIKVSDFRSNDQVQYSLHKHFSELPSRAGKKFLYKNKRTGERDSNYVGIVMEEFVKTLHAFQYGPDDVYGGTQYLFDTSAGYKKLFGDQEVNLTSDKFQELAGIWFLCEYVKELWKETRQEVQAEALERRWMLYFAVGESLRILYRLKRMELVPDLQYLADPRWKNSRELKYEHIRAVAKAHTEAALQALKKAYESARRQEGFTHRNWFRDESTLREIHSHLESFSVFMSQMPEKYLFTGNSAA
jgi:hypothetical protein